MLEPVHKNQPLTRSLRAIKQTQPVSSEEVSVPIPLDGKDTLTFSNAAGTSQSEIAVGCAEPLPPGVPLSTGRATLHHEIARGGMGVILKARDTDFERDLAVKVLQERHCGKLDFRQRFINEGRITARLQHPGIVPIFEAGCLPDERPFFSMRLVKGKNLKQLLLERDAPEQDLPRFLKIFEQVCLTIAYAHSEGIIHRDLKPSNIMVAPYGIVKVLDWESPK